MRVVECLRGEDPTAYATLAHATRLTDDEIDGWRRAADAMFVPRHGALGIV